MQLLFSHIVTLYCTGSKRSNGSNEIHIQGKSYPFESFEHFEPQFKNVKMFDVDIGSFSRLNALNHGLRLLKCMVIQHIDTMSFEPFAPFERQQTQLKIAIKN